MWTRNSDVLNWNMLKHFIYLSFSKLTTSSLCSIYYRYSSKLSSFFYILSFLVIAISIDQTFYLATHYLAAVWLDSRHDFNNSLKSRTKSSSAASFIHKNNESFAETTISLMFYKIWKTQSLALNKETDQLYKLNKQQEDEIKKLKTRLQVKENTFFHFIYSERSRSQKISESSLFTDEKNSTWDIWYNKI